VPLRNSCSSWRGSCILAVGVVLVSGSACGNRLEKQAIVEAHNKTRPVPAASPSAAAPATPVPDAGAGSAAAGAAVPEAGSPGAATGAASNAAANVGSASGQSSGAGGAAGRTAATSASGGAATAKSPTSAGAAARSGSAPSASRGSQTAAAPKPGDQATPSATGVPIVVGSVGTVSGVVGAAVGPGLPAVQAFVAAVNAAGGLKGHPIKHLYADDGGDPARHRQLVQQFVERDKVVAFVFNFALLSGQSSVEYLTQKRVPVLGEQASSEWFYESPMFFPQQSTGKVYVEAMLRGAAAETIPQGKKKLAILNCQEAQFCVDADKMWPGLAPKVGYELVFRRQASLAQPDYTAECLAARNAGADVFGLAMDGNAVGRIGSACARVGFHPVYFIHHGALLVEHAADPNIDGILSTLGLRAWFDSANPVVARYQKALATYAPGQKAKDSSFMGWAAGELFQATVDHAADPTTSAGLLEGLWAINAETLGDITYPIKYVREQNAPRTLCWFTVRGSAGNWAYTDKGRNRTCF
jgi:branched-chain amino acid transport system substrate-binding protein